MLKSFYSSLRSLPTENKSMVYMRYIFNLSLITLGFFIKIYIFKFQESFVDLMIYNMVHFTAFFVGFSGIGYLISNFQKNIKYMYYIAYFLFIPAFFILLNFNSSLYGIYTFAILFSLGEGSFWNAIFTQELHSVSSKKRHLYASGVAAGISIIGILGPLLMAGIFYIGSTFVKIDPYLIVFSLLPILYLGSYLIARNTSDYIPPKITKKELHNFSNVKKYKFSYLYFIFSGMGSALTDIMLAITAIVLLETEMNIGIFQSLLALVSTGLVIYTSFKRNDANRFYYFFILLLLTAILFVLFSLKFDVYSYIIFSLALVLINPLRRVSVHIYDLLLTESSKIEGGDIYASILFRGLLIWIGRIVALGTSVYVLYNFTFDTNVILVFLLKIIAVILIIRIGIVYLWEKYEAENDIK